MRYSSLLALVLLLLLSGCGRLSGDRALDSGRTLVFFGAASTMEAATRAIEVFEEESGVAVTTSFASSATLARQIEAGADAAVFLSAHADWVAALEAAGLVSERTQLFGNSLVIIVPRDSDLSLSTAGGLESDEVERLALGDPEAVPAGMYAKEALTALGVWEAVEAKAVHAMDVRQALLFVELGEADAGIVYATDAAMTNKVRVEARLDSALAAPIRYSLVLLSDHEDDDEARRLYEFFKSREAAEIFSEYGFDAP